MSQNSYKMPEFLATVAKHNPTFPRAKGSGLQYLK